MQKQEYLYKSPCHAANLNDMRLKEKWCDVTIKVNQREIHAHKVILAANLKYFDAMFSNDSFQESKDGIITMQSIEEADLEVFVSYAYTGEILLTDSNALNLLELANYLSEDGIKKACISFLEEHLKTVEACRIYKLANSIDSQSLKNAAKAKIIGNFRGCSESADFLGFDHSVLTDILSDDKANPSKTQKLIFEGIMRWIMFDAKTRKIHMNDLLSFINITKLTADDLLSYFYKNMVDFSDEYGIMRDTMFYYKSSQIEKRMLVPSLIAVKNNNGPFQFYNFTEQKWSKLKELPDSGGYIYYNTAILNNKMYYVMESNELLMLLQVLDPTTLKRSTIFPSSSIILGSCAMSTCSSFLYLCGGCGKHSLVSNQVLSYNPNDDSLKILTPMETKRQNAAAIFYQGCLYVVGGFNGSDWLSSVEKYDPDTKKWTAVASMRKERYCHAVAVLNGKLYACGGYNDGCAKNSVEVYDSITNCWQLVASMNRPRYGFYVVVHENKLLAIGGGEKTVEVYDPSKDRWQIDEGLTSGLEIEFPRGGLISDSCIVDEK